MGDKSPSNDASPLAKGTAEFADGWQPALAAGVIYRVAFTQTVHENVNALPWQTFESQAQVVVSGPRFRLDPKDIHSVFPPANHAGPFSDALPQVVFRRRTLPWERILQVPCDKGPWMALLLIEEGEAPDHGEPRTMPVASPSNESLLLHLGGDVLVPDLGQPGNGGAWAEWMGKSYLSEDESCLAVDLPVSLFQDIAPQIDDLCFLAYARRVGTENKEILPNNDEDWFSLVIGNRLPQPGKNHRALLVSLEGHEKHLSPTSLPSAIKSVRLATLATWTFRCDEEGSFRDRMAQLTVGGLHLGKEDVYLDGSVEPKDAVTKAFALGYTALDHVMRNGERTVSWFRGPLVPLLYEKPRQTEDLPSCADALLRYDPSDGLFDASYAAAWQLGRLLALQNHSFTLALGRARRLTRARAENDWSKTVQRQSWASWAKVGATVSQERDLQAEARAQTDREESSREVESWLARLVLLYGVPPQYLVPDKAMLPPESLRFFYLDPIWIQTLVQGACSVGDNGYGGRFIDEVMRDISPLSESVLAIRDELRRQAQGKGSVSSTVKDTYLKWPLSGFLLRSTVVEGWQGLETTAQSDDGELLMPLRIERLAGDVLLGIFNGPIEKLTIGQPDEALHTAIHASEAGVHAGRSDARLDPAASAKAAVFRICEHPGVVNLRNLATEMAPRGSSTPLGSAAFARSLTASSTRFCFGRSRTGTDS